jgi:hypothetical protein
MITILQSRSKLPDNMSFETHTMKPGETVESFETDHPGVDGYLWGRTVYYNGREVPKRYRIEFGKVER